MRVALTLPAVAFGAGPLGAQDAPRVAHQPADGRPHSFVAVKR